MKAQRVILAILFLVSTTVFSHAQENNCKVLKPEIAVKYSGGCKKGLANGKGVAEGTDKYEGNFKAGLPNGKGKYRYANGDVYNGNFKDGMRDGDGMFTFKSQGKDSTYTGIWKDDKLVKKVIPAAYQITQHYNADRYTVQKIGPGKRIMFSFMQNGMSNYSISGLNFAETGGTSLELGRQQGFDNIPIPFHCKVTYTTANSFRTASYEVTFEIQINEPGSWLITITN